MHTLNVYLYAKCHVPVPLHKQEADERSGGCNLGLKTVFVFYTYYRVAKKLMVFIFAVRFILISPRSHAECMLFVLRSRCVQYGILATDT